MDLAGNFNQGFQRGFSSTVQNLAQQQRAKEFESNLRQQNIREYEQMHKVAKNTLQNIYDKYGQVEYERALEKHRNEPKTQELLERVGLDPEMLSFQIDEGSIGTVQYVDINEDNLEKMSQNLPEIKIGDRVKMLAKGRDITYEQLDNRDTNKNFDYRKYTAQGIVRQIAELAKVEFPEDPVAHQQKITDLENELKVLGGVQVTSPNNKKEEEDDDDQRTINFDEIENKSTSGIDMSDRSNLLNLARYGKTGR